MEYLVKLFFTQKAQCHTRLFQRNIFFKCLFGGFGGVFVADVGVERRNQHQGVVQIAVHLFLVGTNAHNAVIVEGNEEDVLRSLDKLSGLSRKWKGRFVEGISISCGYATNKEYSDLGLIITTADQGMYESKSRYYLETGKDRRTR